MTQQNEEPVHLPAPTLTPLSLLDKAIEKGINPDQLGKLIDLAEQWRQARAREAYFAAMADAQAELPVVIKNADNKQTKSRYAKLEAVNRALVPVVTRHGFSLSATEEECPKEGWTRIALTVRHRDGYSETFRKDWPPEGQGIGGNRMMTGTHATGSTISYARRYQACMAFNVTIADEDNDGNGHQPGQADPSEKIVASAVEEIQSLLKPAGIDTGDGIRRMLDWIANRQGSPCNALQDVNVGVLPELMKFLRRKVEQRKEGAA